MALNIWRKPEGKNVYIDILVFFPPLKWHSVQLVVSWSAFWLISNILVSSGLKSFWKQIFVKLYLTNSRCVKKRRNKLECQFLKVQHWALQHFQGIIQFESDSWIKMENCFETNKQINKSIKRLNHYSHQLSTHMKLCL